MASFSEIPFSEEAADCLFKVPFILVFFFFARFPLEGATFRDLCSPIGPSRLHSDESQLLDFHRQGIEYRQQAKCTSSSALTGSRVTIQKGSWS